MVICHQTGPSVYMTAWVTCWSPRCPYSQHDLMSGRPTTHPGQRWSSIWWSATPCGKENITVCRRFRTNPSSHLLKWNRSPTQREGKIPTNSCKGLSQPCTLTRTHRKDRPWWIVLGKSLLYGSFKVKNLQSSSRQLFAAVWKSSLSSTKEH